MYEPYGRQEVEDMEPEPATTVDALQVPVPANWSWDADKVVWIAVGIVGVGFAVWFLMQYSSAKAKAVAASVLEATTDGGN